MIRGIRVNVVPEIARNRLKVKKTINKKEVNR